MGGNPLDVYGPLRTVIIGESSSNSLILPILSPACAFGAIISCIIKVKSDKMLFFLGSLFSFSSLYVYLALLTDVFLLILCRLYYTFGAPTTVLGFHRGEREREGNYQGNFLQLTFLIFPKDILLIIDRISMHFAYKKHAPSISTLNKYYTFVAGSYSSKIVQ